MDRLKEMGERVEAQGTRITDVADRGDVCEERLSRHSERISVVENAVIEIKTTIKNVGWVIGIAVPVASAILIKFVG